MIAAVTLPLIAMVGGAVDMSRAYLVKVRLQQACDAGALAARRVMTGSSVVGDTNANTQGQNFFNINLAQGAYGATNITFALSDTLQGGKTVGIVHGDATATVPTTLMKVFGQPAIAMTAQCEAQLNVANNDIMFVLDVTGSMACLPSDATNACSIYAGSNLYLAPNGHWATTEKADSRIDGLRSAVKDFYATILAATSSTARLRVGFVPYSSGVNVGAILQAVNATSVVTGNVDYDSRIANFTTPQYTPSTGAFSGWSEETYGSSVNSTNCNLYGQNLPFTGFAPSPQGSPAPAAPTAVITGGSMPANVVTWEYRFKSRATSTTCKREKRSATTTYSRRYVFTDWNYVSQSYNVANFVAGTATLKDPLTAGASVTSSGSWNAQQLLTLAGATGFNTVAPVQWDGCIEERITGNADIDTAPTSDANRWRPSWPGVFYARTTGVTSEGGTTRNGTSPNTPAYGGSYTTNFSCPKAATRLATMTQAQVDAYVDGGDFLAHGQTYHDIGMLWGVRIMSTTGLFSADHGAAPNGKPVNRHIIFMTDGAMEPSMDAYSTYGIERLDRRILGPSGTDLAGTHNARFLAACQAAKDRGISVWAVSFATALTSELTACADSGQAFAATSSADLIQKFQTIAQKIAELRLSK